MMAAVFLRGARRLAAPLLFLFTTSCLDMVTGDCRLIVGRIYLSYANGDNGYRLGFADSNFSCSAGGNYEPIVEDEILEVWGNDSLLYFSGADRGDTNFYRIHHDHGKSITDRKSVEALVPSSHQQYHWKKP